MSDLNVTPADLRRAIRNIPDFPKPGVVFKDITPLLADVDAFRFAVDAIADHYAGNVVHKVIGVEARGFIVAAPIAYRLIVPGPELPADKATTIATSLAPVVAAVQTGADAAAKATTPTALATIAAC